MPSFCLLIYFRLVYVTRFFRLFCAWPCMVDIIQMLFLDHVFCMRHCVLVTACFVHSSVIIDLHVSLSDNFIKRDVKYIQNE